MSLNQSIRTGIATEPFLYTNFDGLDTTRDDTSLEDGKKQALIVLNNAYADWCGAINNEAPLSKRIGELPVKHVNFYGHDLLAWAEHRGAGIAMNSDRGHIVENAYKRNDIIVSTVFNRRLIFAANGKPMRRYDGIKWDTFGNDQAPNPAYVASIQRRLAVAGVRGNYTTISFSRVDDESIMPWDEEAGAVQVTKAADIDIKNYISTADGIRGLAPFGPDKLAIFTLDRVLVYAISPDYTAWQINNNANIHVGTISHNSIVQVGQDLFFCSRSGVHSLRLSAMNGIVIYNVPLSIRVQKLYESLVKKVANPENISACYDKDAGQYHVYFPTSESLSTRLTFSLNPVTQEGAQLSGRWSTGDYMNETCGAFLGGSLVVGTPFGIMQAGDDGARADGVVVTPILWHGDISTAKESQAVFVQATGKGEIVMESFDETKRPMSSHSFYVGEFDEGFFPDAPMVVNYQKPFQHKYRGVRLKFTLKSKGDLKLLGAAILLRKG